MQLLGSQNDMATIRLRLSGPPVAVAGVVVRLGIGDSVGSAVSVTGSVGDSIGRAAVSIRGTDVGVG